MNAASACNQAGDTGKAIAHLEKAIEMDPSLEMAYLQTRRDLLADETAGQGAVNATTLPAILVDNVAIQTVPGGK